MNSIGVTGKHGSRGLLEHITRHIDSGYQRAGQPERQGSMDILDVGCKYHGFNRYRYKEGYVYYISR